MGVKSPSRGKRDIFVACVWKADADAGADSRWARIALVGSLLMVVRRDFMKVGDEQRQTTFRFIYPRNYFSNIRGGARSHDDATITQSLPANWNFYTSWYDIFPNSGSLSKVRYYSTSLRHQVTWLISHQRFAMATSWTKVLIQEELQISTAVPRD